MGKKEKLIGQLKAYPRDFSFNELESLLGLLGFEKSNSGRTSGCAVSFINRERGIVIKLHRPHPQKELKGYQVREILNTLHKEGLI